MTKVEWIKIVTSFFKDDKTLLIEEMRNKDSILIIWFKLLCMAGEQNNDGVFVMSNGKPYTVDMLVTIFKRSKKNIQEALDVFESFGMIEIIEGVITIPKWNKYQTLDSYEKKKERDRIYQKERRDKQRQKALESSKQSSDKSCDVCFSDKEEDIEEDKEKEIKKKKVSRHCENCSVREECDKTVEEHFEKLWEVYKNKTGKGSISNSRKKFWYENISYDEGCRAIERYEAYVKSEHDRGFNLARKQGSTFFNSGYVDYLDENYVEPDKESYVYSSNTVCTNDSAKPKKERQG